MGTSECPVMPGEVLISSRKGWRSLARIMMSARAQPRQPRRPEGLFHHALDLGFLVRWQAAGQWYCVVSVKYLFW